MTEASIVNVDLGDRSYPIYIDSNVDIAKVCSDLNGRRGLLISDSQVGPLHAERVQQAFAAAGADVVCAEVPAGESSKRMDIMPGLFARAIEHGMERSSFIVALGGGMVGDLAGYTAASYLRGVEFIQIPTSLLAMVDSSVGGKTGVNLPEGKNLVGAFYQPSRVIADISMLTTLSRREFLSGMAEVVKYGIIYDADFFSYLENHLEEIKSLNPDALTHIIRRSCEIKADVVEQDEKEGGLRAILNYGHTLGHAIEQADGYGAWLHGEAISIGMVYASILSSRVASLTQGDAQRVAELLSALELPVKRANHGNTVLARAELTWAELRDVMSSDKKSRGRIPRFVLADRIGSVRFGCEVEESLLEEVWHVSNQ